MAVAPKGGAGWLIPTGLAMAGWGIMGVMSKMASLEGLSPGLSVVVMKTPEFAYVLYSIVASSDVNKAAFAAASTKGILCMAFGGLSNILGTVFYNKAIARGSATAVTGLSACYPAVTLLLAAMLVGDKINKAKILGVLLAAGSGVAFSQA